jgi:hypothetical protein
MLDAVCMSAAEPSKECNVLGNTEVWTGEASSQVWPEMSVCPEAAHGRELGRRKAEKSVMYLANAMGHRTREPKPLMVCLCAAFRRKKQRPHLGSWTQLKISP